MIDGPVGDANAKPINRQTQAASLQTEFEEAGITFVNKTLKNERDKVTVRLIEENLEKEWFMALWERIKARTRYQVHYDTEKLIESAAQLVKDLPTTNRPKLDQMNQYECQIL